jgi:hypothetical protein
MSSQIALFVRVGDMPILNPIGGANTGMFDHSLKMTCKEEVFPCGGGISTSTVALRVVKREGNGTQCPGVYLGHPVPGGYKYGDLALLVGGGLRIETIKYGLESRGTAQARTSSNSKLHTRNLVREGATKFRALNCLKKISSRKKNWSRVPDGCLTPRRTGCDCQS